MTETRRDSDGRRLGPKPLELQQMPYDLKQTLGVREPRLPTGNACPCLLCQRETDISGNVIYER